jgi:hypothetical protein
MSWQGMADRAAGHILRTFDENPVSEVWFLVDGNPDDKHRIEQAVFDNAYIEQDPHTNAVVSSHNPTLGVRLLDLPRLPTPADMIQVRGKLYTVDDVIEDGVTAAVLILREA